MGVDLKSLTISAFFIVSILLVNTESDNKEAEFFKLLRKLDSIKIYKRKEACEKLSHFLYKNPYNKYISVLKRRSRKVRLEQRLLLLNLVEKFNKIAPYLKIMYRNNFLQQCPKLRLHAIDFLTDTKSYYKYNEKVNNRKCAYVESYECNTYHMQSYLNKLFFYIGLFKEKNPITFVTAAKNISDQRLDELLQGGRKKGRFFLPITLAEIVDRYNIANVYLHVKSRKRSLRKISSMLLPYACFKKLWLYTYSTYPYDYEQYNILKNNSCSNFLSIFDKYISKKSKYDLKEQFRNVISKIKLKTATYPLKQLLLFERNIDAINKFKLFPQAMRYKSILQEVISYKLKTLRLICKRKSERLGLHNIEECGYTIKYMRSINKYNEIIKNINSGCLCLYVNFNYISLSQYGVGLFSKRKNVLKKKIKVAVAQVRTNESVPLCEKDVVDYLMCRNPLYALKVTAQCKSKKLKRFVLRTMSNFDSYSKICLQKKRSKNGFYENCGYYHNLKMGYVNAIEIMGKLKKMCLRY